MDQRAFILLVHLNEIRIDLVNDPLFISLKTLSFTTDCSGSLILNRAAFPTHHKMRLLLRVNRFLLALIA